MPKKISTAVIKELTPKTAPASGYAPKGDEAKIRDYAMKRIGELKQARKLSLSNFDKRSIEDVWMETEREYAPHELSMGGKKVLATDETKGWRGRWVELGSEDWQSKNATPDLYVKVMTALSILIDQNPEAVFEATARKYEANTRIAQSAWKQSWVESGGKKELKLFVFNMAKMGVGYLKTCPKLDVRTKRVRTEYDPKNPKNDVYEDRQIVRYNGLTRRSLNPWDVWVDDTAVPGRYDDVGDIYYEVEYNEENFKTDFPESAFPNVKFCNVANEVPADNETEHEQKKDDASGRNIRIGFYENQRKDLYIILDPVKNVILYSSPLPNDEGYLPIVSAPWTLRSDKSIYGIGIFEIIKGDSVLYDRVSNMTVDQLVLSIYKSFFHKGIDQLGEDGTLKLSPGEGQQMTDPASLKWLEVPGPGQEAWKGLQYLQDRRDLNSGVPQQLAGRFNSKTLGQDLQAKEAALERMKLPLDFIVDALEQEAYITLSWLKQILSTPEIIEFSDVSDLEEALKEHGMTEDEIRAYLQQAGTPEPNQELIASSDVADAEGNPQMDENGNPVVQKYANVYPEMAMELSRSEGGELFETEQKQFFRFGVDIPTKRLDWKGKIRVIPQSVLVPSKELSRRLDLDLFNLVYPAIQAMTAVPRMIPILLQPIKQIIKSFQKDYKAWVQEDSLMQLYEASLKPVDNAGANVKPTISLQFNDLNAVDKNGIPQKITPTQKEILEKYYGIKVEEPLFIQKGGMGNQDATAVGSDIPVGGGGAPQPEFSTKSGIEAPQVADIGKAPGTMSGSVEAANRT